MEKIFSSGWLITSTINPTNFATDAATISFFPRAASLKSSSNWSITRRTFSWGLEINLLRAAPIPSGLSKSSDCIVFQSAFIWPEAVYSSEMATARLPIGSFPGRNEMILHSDSPSMWWCLTSGITPQLINEVLPHPEEPIRVTNLLFSSLV